MPDKLFDAFGKKLEEKRLITHEGTIVDATFADAPKQRNHHDENKQIQEGSVPEAWKKPENAHIDKKASKPRRPCVGQ